MRIIIDADACPRPVLEICLKVGQESGREVHTVASFNHNVRSEHHTVVGDSSQETDIYAINLTERGDIVITQDYGLAAIALGRGAFALSPMGKEYTVANIAFLLEERTLKAKYRRGGGRTPGPKKRTRDDDERFFIALCRIIGYGQ
ncbi:MAG: DUF188 domain-containing protein [bacterium]|nr:DUF188 domain-containing protein [bacterium]